jgi:hypothetical protein
MLMGRKRCVAIYLYFLDEYTATYEPDDQMEWYLVLGEIKAFIEADTIVNVLDSDSNSIVLSHRLNPLITPPVERSPIMTLSLQEVKSVPVTVDSIKILILEIKFKLCFSYVRDFRLIKFSL